MKKILFITQNMKMNGANKSLINLLNVIDKEKYEIDLFAFTHDGILAECIPSGVHLIEEEKYMKYFANSMSDIFKSANLIGKFIRCLSAFEKKITGCPTDPHTKFILWKFSSDIRQRYDVAIAWNEGACHKFLVEKVTAKIKIGWCHIDDEAWPYHYKLQKKYFSKLDYICTVSKRCKKALLNRYNIPENKIKIVRNIMPIQSIVASAQESFDKFDSNQINILTITRNEKFKNNKDVISAAIQLHERGLNTHWWILGGGFLNDEYNMNNKYLTFVRPVKNPYVYLKNCDIYVQTSHPGEAWGMGVNEAKIFNKPIIVSEAEVFGEQIINNETGLIYDYTVEDLVKKIILLIENKSLSKKFQNNLKSGEWSNINDLEILYSLIEGVKR